MMGLVILLVGAAVAHAIARWVDLPPSPFLLLVGIVLGQFGVLPQEILQEALVLGLTFLLLVLGIELNPRRPRVKTKGNAALRVGVIQFFTLGLVGGATALALGLDPVAASHVGLALAASSTLVVVRLLQRKGRLFEPFGRLVVGVLLVQDALVILFMPVVMRAPAGTAAMMSGIGGTLLMIALAAVLMRWVTPRLVSLEANEETLLLAALAIPFALIGLADQLALPLAAGAFLGGVALSPFPTSGVVRAQLSSVADFFTPVFFLSLGGILMTPDLRTILLAVLLAAVVLVLTPPLVTFLAERAGLEARPAVESGLIIAQTSELSLVVGLHALVLGQIGDEIFTILVLVTIITMTLTPYLVSDRALGWALRLHPVRRRARGTAPASGHFVLLGCGSGGTGVLEALVEEGFDVIVVDDDPGVISRLRDRKIRCIRGDASDPGVLRMAAAHRARAISSTIRRPRDNDHALDFLRGRPVLVRVFEDVDADWVRERGGIPVLYSEAAAEDFVLWYETMADGD